MSLSELKAVTRQMPILMLCYRSTWFARDVVCRARQTEFGWTGRRPFCYPNPGVTMRTFPSDRGHLRVRHVGDPMTDNADFSEFRDIQHWRQLLRQTLEPHQCHRQPYFEGVVKVRPFIKNISASLPAR